MRQELAMQLLKIIGGVAVTIILIVLGLVRLAFEVIGASTAPDDFQQLQDRMPKIMAWLFTTPWPVPTLLFVVLTALAGWLLWSGARKTAQEAVTVTPDEIRAMIAEAVGSVEVPPQSPLPNFSEWQTRIVNELGPRIDTLNTLVRNRTDRLWDALYPALEAEKFIRAKEAMAIVEKELETTEQAIARSGAKPSFDRDARTSMYTEHAYNFLSRIGEPGQPYSDHLQKRHSAIRADAEYLNIAENEKGVWPDGKEKRNAFLNLAYIQAWADTLRPIKRRYEDAITAFMVPKGALRERQPPPYTESEIQP